MSNFGGALSELLQRKNMKAVRLAELSGVSQPTLSRYISGDQTWVSPDDLSRLAQAISENPMEQAELVLARLLDERIGPGSELIEMSIRGHPSELKKPRPAHAIRLSDHAEEDFGVLREWFLKDNNVKELVQGLANLLRSGECRTAGEGNAEPKPVGRVKQYPAHRRKTQTVEADPALNENKPLPGSTLIGVGKPPLPKVPPKTVPRREEPKIKLSSEESN